jgi:transposase
LLVLSKIARHEAAAGDEQDGAHYIKRRQLGLAPRQHSTGGKQRLGSISKIGERTIRRLLIIGGSSVVQQACRRGAPAGSWLEGMLARKPRMLVSVALAN